MKIYKCLSFTLLLSVAGCTAAETSSETSLETTAVVTPAPSKTQLNDPSEFVPKIVTPAERRSVAYPGHEVHALAEMTDTKAGLYLQEAVVRPKSMGAPPHKHRDEDEYFIVMDGTISFLNGENTVTAGPGTVAILPRGHWHGFWNATDQPVRMILAVAPGNFGGFFDEVVMEIRDQNAETPEAIGGIIGAVAASRNVTVDMSRLPPQAAALLAPPAPKE